MIPPGRKEGRAVSQDDHRRKAAGGRFSFSKSHTRSQAVQIKRCWILWEDNADLNPVKNGKNLYLFMCVSV